MDKELLQKMENTIYNFFIDRMMAGIFDIDNKYDGVCLVLARLRETYPGPYERARIRFNRILKRKQLSRYQMDEEVS